MSRSTAALPGATPRPHRRRASDPPRRAAGVLGLYLAFWHYADGQRHRVILSSTMLVASQIIKLAIPWLAAQAINAIQQGGPDSLERAGLLILGIIGTAALSWALHGPGRVIERSVAMHVRRRLADGLYAKLGRLPLPWHERHHTGETLQRIHKTTSSLTDFAQNQFLYLQNLVNLVGPIIALSALSPATGGIALLGYAFIGVVIVRFDRVLIRLANEENEADRRYNASLIEFIGNIQSVLALRLQSATRALLGRRIEGVLKPLARAIVVVEYKWCAVDLLSISLTWGLVAVYAIRARDPAGALLLGNIFMIYQYAGQAASVIGSLAANLQQFARYRADYGSADPVMQAPDAPRGDGRLPPDWKEVELRGLSFTHAHQRGERPGLDDARFSFRRGEKLALIGPSGAGKSTLMRVLAGLYQPDHGHYLVDGEPVAGLRSLARVATFIPQDTEVFEASVRDNLTFGAEPDEARLKRATHASAFDAVLETLPQGLDTPIVERGTNLSGGQKQRLALARGLLAASDSRLVMLDEPTSALDAVTEAQVFERLRTDYPDVTVMASIHRLSVLHHFDRVVLMQSGRVVDVGTVEELSARSALFRRLLRGQPADAPDDGRGARGGRNEGPEGYASALAQAAADADSRLHQEPVRSQY